MPFLHSLTKTQFCSVIRQRLCLHVLGFQSLSTWGTDCVSSMHLTKWSRPSVSDFLISRKRWYRLCMLGTGFMLGPLLQSESMYISSKSTVSYTHLDMHRLERTWHCLVSPQLSCSSLYILDSSDAISEFKCKGFPWRAIGSEVISTRFLLLSMLSVLEVHGFKLYISLDQSTGVSPAPGCTVKWLTRTCRIQNLVRLILGIVADHKDGFLVCRCIVTICMQPDCLSATINCNFPLRHNKLLMRWPQAYFKFMNFIGLASLSPPNLNRVNVDVLLSLDCLFTFQFLSSILLRFL